MPGNLTWLATYVGWTQPISLQHSPTFPECWMCILTSVASLHRKWKQQLQQQQQNQPVLGGIFRQLTLSCTVKHWAGTWLHIKKEMTTLSRVAAVFSFLCYHSILTGLWKNLMPAQNTQMKHSHVPAHTFGWYIMFLIVPAWWLPHILTRLTIFKWGCIYWMRY